MRTQKPRGEPSPSPKLGSRLAQFLSVLMRAGCPQMVSEALCTVRNLSFYVLKCPTHQPWERRNRRPEKGTLDSWGWPLILGPYDVLFRLWTTPKKY